MSDQASFWARRREGVIEEEKSAQLDAEAQAVAADHAALEDLTDAEVLAALELPDPDTLKLGDDFTAFMAKAVPEHIRRRALRTLWRSNPVLANVDMLVDYGEDFTDSAMAVENLQTAYQVGKGMMKHVEEMARQAAELENPQPVEVEPEDAAPDDVETEELIADAALDAPDDPVAAYVDAPEELHVPPTPRRMAFRIEETA